MAARKTLTQKFYLLRMIFEMKKLRISFRGHVVMLVDKAGER